MFKRLLSASFFVLMSLAGFAAQLTATLQSGEKVTPFYGTNAFVDAYNAAVDGDVITLSPGTFTATEIKKGITVIGAYAFSDDSSKSTCMGSFTISADNVSMEGIRIGNGTLAIKGADNLTVSRSYIFDISDEENGEKKYHDNSIFSDCMILKHQAMSLSKNAVFKNCCINYFADKNESSYPALIENCNIPCFKYSNDSRWAQPYAIYRNCFLGLYNFGTDTYSPTLNLYSPSEFFNVIFCTNCYEPSTDDRAKDFSIYYNSCITDNVKIGESKYNLRSNTDYCRNYSSFASYTYDGLTVGPSEVKEYPAIPEITSSEIDTETDAEGNLHVKISATARD